MLGIIGGSGLYGFFSGKEKQIKTAYGEATLIIGKLSGSPCAFLARHGKTHTVPPHMIRHRANIAALKKIGVTKIVSISSVGIISKYRPGDLVLVKDFISLHGPPTTFFDCFPNGPVHADMTEPYDRELQNALKKSAKKTGVSLKDGGILANTLGPRFETKAEIRAYKKLGANLVGMTSVPEAILAKELGVKFCNLAIAANYATGIAKAPLTIEEVLDAVRKKEGSIRKVLSELARIY